MAGRKSRRAEIEALRAELSRTREAGAAGGTAGPSSTPGETSSDAAFDEAVADAIGLGAAGATEALALMDELKAHLEDGLTETREFTSHNPVTALAAAFLLGLAVGRLWRS
ncbi:MAG TPA: hypothetical protein VMP03_15050 [Methylomirabilota bacterium]|nr:hypothetical protein [Methylomirabilota bacterium]